MKTVLRLLAIIMAPIGMFALAAWALWSIPAGSPDPAFVGQPIVSPDGAFKAVELSWNGGGGISPYCYDRVAVVRTDAPAADLNSDASIIFGSDCDTFSDHALSPKIEWTAPDQLKVTFSINEAAASTRKYMLRKLDATRSVHVSFVVGE